MANPEVSNVLKTGAVLWFAPVGETIPDETAVAYGDDWPGNWRRVGYTKAPLRMMYEDEQVDIETEEELAPVNRFRTSETLALETELAELTAEYLALAGGDQDTVVETSAAVGQKAYEEVGFGGSAIIAQYAWGFEGFRVDDAGDQQPVRMVVRKGTAKLNGELEFSQKSDGYPGIPLRINALADTSQLSGQKLALFQRVTAPAVAGP